MNAEQQRSAADTIVLIHGGLTCSKFHYAVTNTMDEADAEAALERYAVPASGRVLLIPGGALEHARALAPT